MAVSTKQVVVQFQFVELIIWAGAYDASAFFGKDKYNVAYEPPLYGKDYNDYLRHLLS